jgi:hypothetical protein
MVQGDLGMQPAEERRLYSSGSLGPLPVCSGLIWPSWLFQWAVTVGQQPSPTVEQV